MLTPMRNSILFAFVDNFNNNKFKSSTGWGFEIQETYSTTANEGRWAKVIAIGPEVSNDIPVGKEVFIEHLMWTPGFKHDGVEIWKTDESKVMLVRD